MNKFKFTFKLFLVVLALAFPLLVSLGTEPVSA